MHNELVFVTKVNVLENVFIEIFKIVRAVGSRKKIKTARASNNVNQL